MQDPLQELQATLYHEIPITQYLGISVDSYIDGCLVLKAPLDPNINHKRTVFAGSLNAVVTLAGWGQLWLTLKELGIPAKIVIQDSSSNYLSPVKNDFSAHCHKPTAVQVARLESMLKKKGKARVELTAQICVEDSIAVAFKGRYVIYSI